MTTVDAAKARQKRRPARARVQDARKTSKRTVSISNERGVILWMRRPGKLDIAGIDTKGMGLSGNVGIRPSQFKKTKKRKKA